MEPERKVNPIERVSCKIKSIDSVEINTNENKLSGVTITVTVDKVLVLHGYYMDHKANSFFCVKVNEGDSVLSLPVQFHRVTDTALYVGHEFDFIAPKDASR